VKWLVDVLKLVALQVKQHLMECPSVGLGGCPLDHSHHVNANSHLMENALQAPGFEPTLSLALAFLEDLGEVPAVSVLDEGKRPVLLSAQAAI
jgi:hypothetical protein